MNLKIRELITSFFTYLQYRDSLCIRLYDERSIRVAVFVYAKSSGSTECPGIQR